MKNHIKIYAHLDGSFDYLLPTQDDKKHKWHCSYHHENAIEDLKTKLEKLSIKDSWRYAGLLFWNYTLPKSNYSSFLEKYPLKDWDYHISGKGPFVNFFHLITAKRSTKLHTILFYLSVYASSLNNIFRALNDCILFHQFEFNDFRTKDVIRDISSKLKVYQLLKFTPKNLKYILKKQVCFYPLEPLISKKSLSASDSEIDFLEDLLKLRMGLSKTKATFFKKLFKYKFKAVLSLDDNNDSLDLIIQANKYSQKTIGLQHSHAYNKDHFSYLLKEVFNNKTWFQHFICWDEWQKSFINEKMNFSQIKFYAGNHYNIDIPQKSESANSVLIPQEIVVNTTTIEMILKYMQENHPQLNILYKVRPDFSLKLIEQQASLNNNIIIKQHLTSDDWKSISHVIGTRTNMLYQLLGKRNILLFRKNYTYLDHFHAKKMMKDIEEIPDFKAEKPPLDFRHEGQLTSKIIEEIL